MKAIYPGSFDPVTYGHLDIIERAASVFDTVYVAIGINITKEYLFDHKTRKQMLEECVTHLDNVVIVTTDKLIVDYAQEQGIKILIRGLRAVSDFENELQICTTNLFLNSEVETVFLMSRPQHMFLSSSQAREIAKFGGKLEEFVPPAVEKFLRDKYE